MFLIDDILLAPLHGVIWLARELHAVAQAEQQQDREQIIARLSDLYMQLEVGQITEAEFDAAEALLLAQLEQIEANGIDAA